jgi:hypothetical protein
MLHDAVQRIPFIVINIETRSGFRINENMTLTLGLFNDNVSAVGCVSYGKKIRVRDGSVGVATGYRLDGPGIESRWGARFFAHVQTGPGANPASCTMGTGSFSGVKRPGCVADHPPPSSAVVKKEWSYTSTPLWAFGSVTGHLYLSLFHDDASSVVFV